MNSYSFQARGTERKAVARIIAEAINAEAGYAGPPSFAYVVDDISIDRNGLVTIPFGERVEDVLQALKEKDIAVEGDGIITIPADQHTGVSLRNLVNIIFGKERLLQIALGRREPLVPLPLVELVNSVRLEEAEDFAEVIGGQDTGGLSFDFERNTISFGFFNASLEVDIIKAYAVLCTALDALAKKQKYTSFLQKDTDNPKYAFRCFLLRLGFIGHELKVERKILMANLEGNSAFRNKPERIEEAAC